MLHEDCERNEMSHQERDRLKVLHGVIEGERLQKEAARLLRLTTRQVRRLVRRLQEHGDQGLIHRLRGQPSNRGSPTELRQRVLGGFRSRVASVGGEVGYVFQMGKQTGYLNLRGYSEFWAENRLQGYALFATVNLPFGQ